MVANSLESMSMKPDEEDWMREKRELWSLDFWAKAKGREVKRSEMKRKREMRSKKPSLARVRMLALILKAARSEG